MRHSHIIGGIIQINAEAEGEMDTAVMQPVSMDDVPAADSPGFDQPPSWLPVITSEISL